MRLGHTNFAARAACLSLLFVSTSVLADPFGYVVNSDGPDFDTVDSLYRVNLATGQATRIGPVGFADVEGLAISPTGVLYGVDDGSKTLITINTQTGAGTAVAGRRGNLGLSGQGVGTFDSLDFGLAFTCDGALWVSSDSTNRVWHVDPATGVASGVINVGHPISGLAGGVDLFGVTGERSPATLTEIDTQEGMSIKVIGGLGSNLQFDDVGLDFDADGMLWAVVDYTQQGSEQPSDIFRVSARNGAASLIAQTIPGVESLAIAPPTCTNGQQQASVIVPTLSARSLAGLALVLLLFGVWFVRRPAAA
jgi:hypothetical protein